MASKRKRLEFDEDTGMPMCADCVMKLYETPHLVEACASVGMEHGKSTSQMLIEYLVEYHANRHKDPI